MIFKMRIAAADGHTGIFLVTTIRPQHQENNGKIRPLRSGLSQQPIGSVKKNKKVDTVQKRTSPIFKVSSSDLKGGAIESVGSSTQAAILSQYGRHWLFARATRKLSMA